MANKINFTQEQINRIIKMYSEDKMSLKNIGLTFGVSPRPIKRILEENNVFIEGRQKGPEDLAGQVFGKLTVLRLDPNYIPESGKHAKWLCQCECGNIVSIQSNHLKDGSQSACSPACKHKIKAGTKFGEITVLKMTYERYKNGGSVMYECQCDCGNIFIVPSTELRAHRCFHCPDCGDSIGEITIKTILNENNIKFEREKTFDTCINPKTNKKFRYDFYLNDENCLIEYDGEQHFNAISQWKGEIGLTERQQYDKMKNEWSRKNGIKLIRIPYTHLKQITINDLLPNTSTFLVE